MKLRFWGVRGSIPAPGPDTNRYGGNTSCVSLCTRAGELLILDMGTGVMHLGMSLMEAEFGAGKGRGVVLLSHAHWDHIQGFPFFPPIFVAGNRFSIYGHARSPSMLEGVLEGQMNPHYSPIYTLKNLGAEIEVIAVRPGEPWPIGSVEVWAEANPHGTTTALAYRIEENGRSLVYASDVGYPDDGPTPAVLALYRGADVLIHDCTYTPEDRVARIDRGFSSYACAARVAVAARVKHLVMFHYDQDYGDERVDRLYEECRAELDRLGGAGIALTAAAEGLELAV
jgi:phosphoribosyl 1,2-cyclic phosphodiesterase